MNKLLTVAVVLLALVGAVLLGMLVIGFDFRSEPNIGSVDTAWKLVGTDHKIAIDAFDDPKVEGVACFISRARIGGVTGSLGLREDTSFASIDCSQTGPIRFRERFKNGERIFRERRSVLFKTLQVIRFYDAQRKSLVYLSYSDKLISGSPQNSVSAVPLMPWSGVEVEAPALVE